MPRIDAMEMGELTDTAYYIMVSLVEAKHGYLIMQTIEKLTNGRMAIGPASMYTTIKKLLTAGLIEQADEGTDNRKTYVATDKGLNILEKEMERRREMANHAEVILKEKGRMAK